MKLVHMKWNCLVDEEYFMDVVCYSSQPLSPSQMSEFILNRKPWGKYFGHFKPYKARCNYCDFDFDAIIDVEDLDDRIQLIANNLKIKVNRYYPPLVQVIMSINIL